MTGNLRIDLDRLMGRIFRLGEIGALPGGGVKRLALSDEDREARDLVVAWMRELGLTVSVDRIGNICGIRPGAEDLPPFMLGSHIDSVATGGLYDGVLGVLAGLEIVETLNEAGIRTRHPVGVGAFTNEEGARFPPDMMGSGVAQGALDLDEMLAAVGIDGKTVGDELRRLARFAPVEFDASIVDRIEATAKALGHSVKRLPSGAGHDAQMFAPNSPTAMIFVPSKDGLSHNIHEYTAPEEIRAGADVLLQIVLDRAGALENGGN